MHWSRKIACGGILTLLSALLISPVNAAEAAALGCGTIITEDTVLTADVGPCGDAITSPGAHAPGGHGLVIAADNVTLDLNGHTIFAGSVVLHQAAGVRVDERSNVTVKNGTVRGFFHGIHVQNGRNNAVVDIDAIDNTGGNGIVLQNVTDSKVTRNTVINSGGFSGISVFDGRATSQLDDLSSARNTIANNVVDQSDNRVATVGISVENGPGHKVMHNTVTNSAGDGIALHGNRPLAGGVVLPAVTDAKVVNNLVVGNGARSAETNTAFAGISLRRTAATGVGADGNKIVGNRVHGNTAHGILVASSDNMITGNDARGNSGDDLRDTNTSPPCDANKWRGNKFVTFNQACVTR